MGFHEQIFKSSRLCDAVLQILYTVHRPAPSGVSKRHCCVLYGAIVRQGYHEEDTQKADRLIFIVGVKVPSASENGVKRKVSCFALSNLCVLSIKRVR